MKKPYILKINNLIDVKKITQVELAILIKKNKHTVGNWLNEKTKLDVDSLIEIAEVLHVHPSVFFKDEEIHSQINGNYNNIGNGHGNNITINTLEKEVENLKERIADKERIIQEKERTIEILIKKT